MEKGPEEVGMENGPDVEGAEEGGEGREGELEGFWARAPRAKARIVAVVKCILTDVMDSKISREERDKVVLV